MEKDLNDVLNYNFMVMLPEEPKLKRPEISEYRVCLPYARLTSYGYVKYSGALRKTIELHGMLGNTIRFKASKGGTCGIKKYSAKDLFGVNRLYYHVVNCEEAKQDFSKFLTRKFLKTNPNPPASMKTAFTMLLHGYDMHSKLCYHLRYEDITYSKSTLI